jgi:O-antigen ligase
VLLLVVLLLLAQSSWSALAKPVSVAVWVCLLVAVCTVPCLAGADG